MNRPVLAVIAHPDDELAFAGTLIRHAEAGHPVIIAVITAGTSGPGNVSERVAEMEASAGIIGAALTWGDGFIDGAVNRDERALVAYIEQQIALHKPDIIYTHADNDSHQDHRAVAQCTLGAARGHNRILQFEAPSTIGFNPTMFVDITATIDRKMKAVQCHDTQIASSRMIDPDYLQGLAKARGFQARCPMAEAFQPVRYTINI